MEPIVMEQAPNWVPCVGDFAILKEFYAEKGRSFWSLLQLLDATLRGFGQVVFANNPLSGLLIVVSLAVAAPGALALSAATGVLGLSLSVLTREAHDKVENGLTVFNPVLVGAISHALIPRVYGPFDSFSLLFVVLGTILSVYLARSLGGDKFPCTVWPFNLVELALICALSTQNGTEPVESILKMHNATSEMMTTTTTRTTSSVVVNGAGSYAQNASNVYIDWGMIVRGVVVSSSQPFAVDDAMFGSAVYLAILLFSPTTALFSFLGGLIGTLAGLELGVELDEVYNGSWGYNSLLTGAALGGNLLVLNCQTTAATLVAIVYTALLQYCVLSVFRQVHLPMLSVPFVVAVTLFVRLWDDRTFPRPTSFSFPEKQRYDYLASRLPAREVDDPEGSKLNVEDQERRGRLMDN